MSTIRGDVVELLLEAIVRKVGGRTTIRRMTRPRTASSSPATALPTTIDAPAVPQRFHAGLSRVVTVSVVLVD